MSENSDIFWLIVEPAPRGGARLEEVVKALGELGVDPYGARQRLVGSGPALLARGKRNFLERIAPILRERDFSCWILRPTPPSFHPHRIFALDQHSDALVFSCRERTVRIPRGGRVLAVLGDISGALVEKTLKRLLARHAYRGEGALAAPPEEEILPSILQQSPVLDLYLLSDVGPPATGVRVFPGRYDPKGLGERVTPSGAGNLRALLEIVREYAGEFTLETGFGLASLPGCQPGKGEPGALQKENLLALTRFGWVMADLRAAGRSAQAPPGGAAEPSPSSIDPAADLPPPPPPGEGNSLARNWLAVLSGGATLLFPLAWMDLAAMNLLLRFGVRTGLLPALLSVLIFLAGVQLLAWKRRIENTPTSRVRSLAMGMVELHGRALRRYALVSPMTHMACVWYRLRRYRRDRNGWRLKGTATSGAVPFALDDGTGRVVIDPRGAVIRPRTRQQGYEGDEKWVEEVLFEGTPVYVLGFARPAPQGHSLRERTAEAMRRLKGDPEAMRRLDRNGDGRICTEEWEAARAEAEARSSAASLVSPQAPPAEPAVVGKGAGRPFIIAEAESAVRVARSYGVIVPLLFGGALLSAALAAALFFRNVLGL